MSDKDLLELIKVFNASSVQTLTLKKKDYELALNKQPKLVNKNETQKKVVKETKTPASLFTLKAPLVGVAFLAPGPTKANFKKVGDKVTKGEVVCVIEAMKVINEVKSPINGVIEEFIINNEEMVEFEQPLFKIRETK